jgi:hypothetical protein
MFINGLAVWGRVLFNISWQPKIFFLLSHTFFILANGVGVSFVGIECFGCASSRRSEKKTKLLICER